MKTKRIKLVRITTVPISMNIILKEQLAYMNKYFDVIGVTSYDKKCFNDIRTREGIRVEAININRNISLFKDLKTLYKFYTFFKKEKPEIVHTHTPKAGLLGMLAARLANVPIRLHTVGGLPQTDIYGIKRSILNITEKITYLCSNRVYPNSKGLKEFILAQKYCNVDKLKVLGKGSSNGVNVDYFSPDHFKNESKCILELKKEIDIDNEDFIFVFVGRIAKDKGILELIQSLDRLTKLERKVKLLLVGTFEKITGGFNEETQNRIINNENVRFLGRFDDVRPYLSISDVFVLPSYREGFPNAVLEAQSMGLPCIVSDINGCNEIITNEYNGLIVPPKTIDELYKAMKTIMKNTDKFNFYKSNSRVNAVENYQRKVIWEDLLKEYNYFLNSKRIIL